MDLSAPGLYSEGTPEVSAVYSGFWRRSAATMIDASAMFFPYCFVTILTYQICEGVLATKRYNSDWAILVWPVVSVIFTVCYFALLESSRQQATLGKMALGLCVTDAHGRRLTLGRAAGRTLAKYVSCLTVGIGFIMCGFTKKKQALHDVIAGCLVVRRQRCRSLDS